MNKRSFAVSQVKYSPLLPVKLYWKNEIKHLYVFMQQMFFLPGMPGGPRGPGGPGRPPPKHR